ncbi:hypothetical protein BGX27_011388 [Mortierella sp. AM989]|nr:hypothetical protein BGX27_011388 [Mortierella sp. AM989]
MAEQWRFFGCTLRDIHNQLGSFCSATLLNGIEYSGYLYSIDPETYTLLMLQRKQKESSNEQSQDQNKNGEAGAGSTSGEASWTMIAVRQHALKAWTFSDSTASDRLTLSEMDTIAHISQTLGNPAEISARKDRLVTLLRSKRIPVETTAEDMVVHIMNCAHVRPPYLAVSIDCSNAVIRERVKGMIQELQ